MERFTLPRVAVKETNARHAVALRRLRPPLNLAVQREGQRLATFSLHGKVFSVEQAYGPWRRSGDWWAAEVWSCEEWDVQAFDGFNGTLLCLLTHDLLYDQWQLEALYD
jgi:protein ImuB